MFTVRAYLLTILLSLIWFSSTGVVNAPEIRRVCLDNSDSVATLEWSALVDACGSFSEYHIYGRKAADPYQLMGIEPNPAAVSFQIKLPDTDPSWTFYLEVLNTCDGFDSVASTPLMVDQSKPVEIQLDSVSVDLLTQKIIMGWQPNPAPDTKGYLIYRYNNLIYSLIGDTTTTSYILLNHNVNTLIQLAMATYDSCDLASPIDLPHSIVYIDGSIDTCVNTISLDWTAYQGWPVAQYGIYVSKNGSGYSRALTTTTLSASYSDFTLGDDLCFFIRAYKQGSNITSSSATLCFSTRKPKEPTELYLSNVTVTGANIQVSWRDELTSDNDSFAVYRSSGNTPSFVYGAKRNGSQELSFIDQKVDVNNKTYTYIVKSYDKCKAELASSNEGGNILLTLVGDRLTWNTYGDWLGDIERHEVWFSDGSTWNMLTTLSPDGTSFIDDAPNITERCYEIRTYEANNPYADKVSVSNQACRIGELIFYLPNAINPDSENNRLRVIGQFIDYEKSSIMVFNRWGQQIYQTNNVDEGWDGRLDGNLVPMGIYFYVADIWGLNGRRESAHGEIRIIR